MVTRSAHEPRGFDLRLSRRQLVGYSGVARAAVEGSGVLRSCVGDDGGGGGGETGGTGGGAKNSGGILTRGTTGGGAKDTLDPHQPVQAADIARFCTLYEP